MKTVDGILREMRELAKEVQGNSISNAYELLMGLADIIEAAVKSYNKEITELLREVIGGVCLHCDLQTSCQEGEDGMSTTCNAVAKATHFINQHTEPESGKDLPF